MSPHDERRTAEATFTGVLTGHRRPFLATATHGPHMADIGWVEVELVAEGVAGSFVPDGEMRGDGRLELGPGPIAPYRTRVVVRRPVEASAFSGTVVVEWLNVSSGLDANPDWAFLSPELVRTGVAWVGVSAQYIGVEGGAIAVDAGEGAEDAGTGLKGHDPERYGSLDHPGDAFAYDIYSQIGAALRGGASVPAFGGLRVEQVLAIGESQSAFALTTYIDGVHPDAWVYDGFLVHSRGRAGLPLGEPGRGITGRQAITGAPQRIRTDLDVPVMIVQTETDLLPVLGYAEARQDDTDLIRLWEIAGTAHADASTLGPFASMVDCGVPINDGPQRFVLRAALRHLVAWAAGGEAPPEAPRLVIDLGPDGARFPRDDDGLTRGGIRLPQVEVPVATLSGDPGPVDTLMCQLLGQTVAFSPARLAELYPTVGGYLAAYQAATDASIAAGFALDDDRDEMLADAHPEVIPT